MPDSLSAVASQPVVAVVGNPNTGKSTLFNNLTGLRQKTANYPGVTVERHTGLLRLPEGDVTLVDLPGAYSLTAYSPDELVSADVLLGKIDDLPMPQAILVVIDACNLRRNLFMTTQILELGLPVVIALNMTDLAAKRGITIDAEHLANELQATVVPVSATAGGGVEQIREALSEVLAAPHPPEHADRRSFVPEIRSRAVELQQALGVPALSQLEVERALIDRDGAIEQRILAKGGAAALEQVRAARVDAAGADLRLAAVEARTRYAWIDQVVSTTEQRGASRQQLVDLIDRATSHPVIGGLLFFLIMATVFQAVFSWANPIMDFIDAGTGWVSDRAAAVLPPGALTSLLIDGVIAGVGSVIIFLPQIMILFAFIIFLEDSGYMARAAFLMDRLMRVCGLSGQSFIPMLSSFACAVPGIMATRVIPNPRDRIATMLAAPFMTCSARLPVYALLIAAFVPDRSWFGMLSLQGLVLFGLYLLGIVGGVFTAWIIKKFALRGPTPTFLIELPPYRLPNIKTMLFRLLERGRVFLYRAGTIIFTVAVVVWALVYFPRPEAMLADFATEQSTLAAEYRGPDLGRELAELERRQSAQLLEQSYLGRAGKVIEPAFLPLGWDWKITAAVIASFPAREVVVAVLGTIYAVGDDVSATDKRLLERLRRAKHPDGTPVFTLGVAVGIMIFFAFCLQCMATVAIMRRETNGWKWPLAAWTYMTSLGYVGALLAYQLIG